MGIPLPFETTFHHIATFCEVTNPLRLLTDHSSQMSEDITYCLNRMSSNSNNISVQNFVTSSLLFELEKLLQDAGYSLSHFNLLILKDIGTASTDNMLILDVLNYDASTLADSIENDVPKLNTC
jgi:hypothetical protein